MRKSVFGKLGNMRKAVEWVVCPRSDANQDTVYVQCDKRICRFNPKTGYGILSNGKGYPGFASCSDMAVALGYATSIIVPKEFIGQCLDPDNVYKSGDCIGPGVYVA